ncbi:hypothetical protein [Acetobacter thailandicus]|uniref:Uncharacterized protein n=1 Tax=Acetobacter thailandicus TaxID=1502842 RepID=A0ABT3QGE7_9PROT|nr:hypothetical protein [Acetobacter thailandicus]MBS0980152.1 hypothetical protein [Acetobacter thailandicus]MBS0985998.1 hypothetical protein [Acetobacter thailandicus]MCX2564341.1 hypothetical protein [Acetobacter thailandicus]NHN95324.1 hypothetical protein [Acetobacter thailandicus]
MSSSAPGSVRLTLIKTLLTVGLTVVLVMGMRFFLTVLPRVDAATGGHAGADILRILTGDGSLTRQKIVTGCLLLVCFLLALFLLWVGQIILKRIKT